ncbi:MAG: hypothetical protein COV59_00590 [Candidatus Magasanikbacteria bacterium CG11_big_fil_rev_8_21_14_0_20_39_34]|uniref:Cold-shock protein n=1 Tax=Candidatus Magasanikbacteria bacterium CG11_big_fil_rev_8_21_14_0_20_39_34 TaxID=1974653 RepID=A0A2H0N6G5_9BACT|nr:MAG: hypothetical protein COV59_00590 [Candidatus Magasanikbacteria bacterium CG11_big_fil_rev_8_21_14_0_20_39_34]
MKGIILYLVIINGITFFIFGLDKYKSRKKYRRISEKSLWIASLLGGSPTALFAMKFFRHKTKKTSFQAGIILILALQLGLIFFFLSKKF